MEKPFVLHRLPESLPSPLSSHPMLPPKPPKVSILETFKFLMASDFEQAKLYYLENKDKREHGFLALDQAAFIGAKLNNAEMYKWLVEQNHINPNTDAFYMFASHGNLDMLKWLRKQKCPGNGTAYVRAIENDHTETIQWLIRKKCHVVIRVPSNDIHGSYDYKPFWDIYPSTKQAAIDSGILEMYGI